MSLAEESSELSSVETSMWMENLSEWLFDEKKLVSVKFLSRHLRCHVNVSKQRLWHFKESLDEDRRNEIEVVYLVAGTDPENGLRTIRLLRQTDLSSNKLSSLTSKHVYCLAPKALLAHNCQPMVAQELDLMKQEPYLNTFGSIQNRRAVPNRENGQTLKLAKASASSASSSAAKKPEPKKFGGKVKEDEEAPAVKATTGAPAGKKPAAAGGKKGGSGGIAGMFAKAAAKKKEAKPAVAVKEEVEETSPGKENRLNEERERRRKEEEEERKKAKEEAEEERKKKGSKKRAAAKSSSTTRLQPKRKRIQMMADSDSEDDTDAATAEEEDAARVESPAPPQAALIESDNEEEEAVAAKKEPSDDDDDELIPATPDVASKSAKSSGRHRARKLVNKTFVDKDGFMVTKKEYESFSESDGETETKETKAVLTSSKKANKAADAPEPVVKAPAAEKKKLAKKAAASPQKNKQASIMNFFKKK